MPRLNFTVRTIEAIRPSESNCQVDYWDESEPGFGLRVSRAGRKSWIVMYRFNNRLRRLTLGTYPHLSLAEARRCALAALHNAANGIDAASQKKFKRQAETVAELAQEYLERHAKVSKKSWQEDERIIDLDVLPVWKNCKAKEIGRRDIMQLLDRIVDRGSPIMANRTLALVRKMFNFGIQRGVVDTNPCQVIPAPGNEHRRDRVLTPDELRIVWAAIEKERVLIGSLFKLYLLTAQRGAEIRSMAWADLDLETNWWTIPAEKAKNGLTHRVPLSPQARSVIDCLLIDRKSSPWVFPSPKNSAVNIENIQKAVQRIRSSTPKDWTGHDLRRTAASYMTGMGISRLVVSKILNHAEQGITAVYDRHSYDTEKRQALEAWGRKLEEILIEKVRPGLIVASANTKNDVRDNNVSNTGLKVI